LPTSFGDAVREKGWQAGAVVPFEMLALVTQYLVHPNEVAAQVTEDDWLVVVSQTCDVVQLKLENEPYIEVLHCHAVATMNGQFKQLKSTRRLDFRPNREAFPAISLRAHAIADRYLIPRQLLLQHAPNPTRRLSKNATRNIQGWYSLRYSRPAWPDTFVRRLSPAKERLISTLEPIKEDVAEVRISITEAELELPAEADYHVAVFFVVPEMVWNSDADARTQVETAFGDFTSAVDECAGIVVDRDISDVFNGGRFTWEMASRTDAWNFANLSHVD